MIARAEFVRVGREWLGTPWLHQGMVKRVGCDCLGLLAGVALECGIADARAAMRKPEFRAYGREPKPDLLDAVCAEYMESIAIAQATLADVFRLLVPRGVYAQHFAFVSRVDDAGTPTHVIHATSASPRRVVENGLDEMWWGRVARAYQLRGIG